jgi:hypothetical protein
VQDDLGGSESKLVPGTEDFETKLSEPSAGVHKKSDLDTVPGKTNVAM